ncbi:MAG: transporter [Verrucomicrobiaceae bacterium]|nr:transporter [Verrucomicrobiaceae bacterium]
MSLPSSLPRNAWLTVWLLWPVALLNYLDRQMLATMGLSIKQDIVELQSAQTYGNLMAIFMWVYAICSPLGGAIADRVGKKWLIVLSLAVWSTVTLLMGHVHGYNELYWLRAAMGVSEAFYIPAGLALIADYHRGPTRSLAVGVHMSGIYLGQALGGLGGWVAQEVSWRAAFQGCGYIGVGYAFVLMAMLSNAPQEVNREATSDELVPEVQPVNWVGFAILILCFSLPSLPGWAVKNWLPTLLQDSFHMDQKSSGIWATSVVACSSFIGVLIGGRLSDRMSGMDVRGRTWVSAMGLLLLMPALTGLGMAPNFAVAILSAALFGIGFGLFDTNNMPILCQVVPPRMRATAYGVLNCVGIGAGAALTPVLGKMKDQGVPLSQGFALCAIPAVIACILMVSLRPKSNG